MHDVDFSILKEMQSNVNQAVKDLYNIKLPEFDSFATKGHRQHVNYVLFDLIERCKKAQDKNNNIPVISKLY